MSMEWIVALVVLAVLILLLAGGILLYNRLQQMQVKVEEAASDIDVALEKRYDLLSAQLQAVKKYLDHEYRTLTEVTGLRSGTQGENRRLDQQQEISEKVIHSMDAEISRQTRTMEQIKRELDRNHVRPGGSHRIAGRNAAGRKEDLEAAAEQKEKVQAAVERASNQRKETVGQKVGALASVHRDLAGVAAGIDALYEQYPVLNSWMSMEMFQRSISDSEEHLQAARRLYNSNASLYNQTIRMIPWSILASACHMEEADFYEVEEQKRSFEVHFD